MEVNLLKIFRKFRNNSLKCKNCLKVVFKSKSTRFSIISSFIKENFYFLLVFGLNGKASITGFLFGSVLNNMGQFYLIKLSEKINQKNEKLIQEEQIDDSILVLAYAQIKNRNNDYEWYHAREH